MAIVSLFVDCSIFKWIVLPFGFYCMDLFFQYLYWLGISGKFGVIATNIE